jgi:hypothetical protein
VTIANLHSFRVAKLEILAQDTLAHLGNATGFFCEYRGRTFLVTNWHVVSGRNYQTNHPLHRSQALPGALKVHTHLTTGAQASESTLSSSTVFQISLANGDGSPCWLQHPLFGTDVDVIAIDVSSRIVDCERIFRINLETELARDTDLSVMDQAFVTGYPLSATTTPNSLPIYKSGTIASEPRVFDSIPRIYIDGKTKTGMSGSPVMVKQQAHSQKRLTGIERLENGLDFIGIYSGRERQERSEFEAELGIIWPYKECLIPIVESYVTEMISASHAFTSRSS